MKRRTRIAPLLLCVTLALVATACGSDDDSSDATSTPRPTGRAGRHRCGTRSTDAAAPTPQRRASTSKIGFITKFPVDFYDTMVDAAKAWNADHPEVELIFAQGASGTDDEGEIAAIESMVTQGVKAIVITPTSPNVQDALAEGRRRRHQGDPRRQRHPRLGRQDRRSSPPTTWPAACWPASSWPSSSRRATPSPSSKAWPARRRSRTGSTASRKVSATASRSSPRCPPTATRPRASTRRRTSSPPTPT